MSLYTIDKLRKENPYYMNQEAIESLELQRLRIKVHKELILNIYNNKERLII